MTILELLNKTHADFDVYDTEFDESVCCCDMDEEDVKENEGDNYYLFCYNLLSRMPLYEEHDYGIDYGTASAEWCKLIETNFDLFKEFTKRHWGCDYEDKDDFIYNWISEIHYYLAGYTDEGVYSDLVELVDKLNFKWNE